MNRELKFRAWDIESSEMIYSNPGHFDELFFHFDSDGNLKLYLSQEEDFAREREAHIMQFTGLCDKNGKMVYEGDIIKFQIFSNWDDDSMPRHMAKVVFRQGCFMWEIIKEGRQSTFHYSNLHQPLRDTCSTWGLEIIGNIYENPELLNPAEKE